MALPPPPSQGPPTPTPTATDRRAVEASRADGTKLKALHEYRRARGLCFKCGERWGQDHSCPTSIQLHIVEELLELFGIDSIGDPPSPVTRWQRLQWRSRATPSPVARLQRRFASTRGCEAMKCAAPGGFWELHVLHRRAPCINSDGRGTPAPTLPRQGCGWRRTMLFLSHATMQLDITDGRVHH